MNEIIVFCGKLVNKEKEMIYDNHSFSYEITQEVDSTNLGMNAHSSYSFPFNYYSQSSLSQNHIILSHF